MYLFDPFFFIELESIFSCMFINDYMILLSQKIGATQSSSIFDLFHIKNRFMAFMLAVSLQL